MSNNDFGSVHAGDATSIIEKRVVEGARSRNQRLKDSDQIINRPIGSVVDLSDEEQLTDWQALVSDPQELLNKIGQRAVAVGPKRSELETRRWDKDMRTKVSE